MISVTTKHFYNTPAVIGEPGFRSEIYTDQLPQYKKHFQVVIFTGSYHYFYWGSSLNPSAYTDHDLILSKLADITSERVIFSGRLDFIHLTHDLKELASKNPAKLSEFTRDNFIASASKYFHVTQKGNLGKMLLFTLDKKGS